MKKIIAVFIFFVLIAGAGYYFLKNNNVPKTGNKAADSMQQPTGKKLPPAKKMKTLSFKEGKNNYKLEAPEDFQITQSKEGNNTGTVISDGKNRVVIKALEGTGGVPCGFSDAPAKPSEMYPDVSSYTYGQYKEFTAEDGTVFRRANNTYNPPDDISFFAVCQKYEDGFLQPTKYGFAAYELPYMENPEVQAGKTLDTLDKIFASVRLQKD